MFYKETPIISTLPSDIKMTAHLNTMDIHHLTETVRKSATQKVDPYDYSVQSGTFEKQTRLLNTFQQMAQSGHFTLDLATGTWTSSETLNKIFGIDDGYAKTLQRWLDIIHPDNRKEMALFFGHPLSKSNRELDREYRIVRMDDYQERWVHGRGCFEFDTSGNPVKIIGFIQDITQKRTLEEQQFQARKMESVGRLAGGIAHNFNNMLSVILGYSELMRTRLPEDNPLASDLLEIEKAATHSKETTKQLLAFSRKQLISPRPLNLNNFVKTTLGHLPCLTGENTDMVFLPGDSIREIEFDPSQFEQILVNLTQNAKDAMPGGGKLTIETLNVTLDDAYCADHMGSKPGNYVMLAVSDNGIGMDKRTQSQIFEPFFTTKDPSKGSGLGLSTVYGIVKQNNGYIAVYSEPQMGTSFKIYIPQIADKNAPYKKTGIKDLPRGSETILLVDDDEMVRKMTAAMLEKLGYKVIVADSPIKAILMCRENKTGIDLLLTDVMMPEMTGVELKTEILAIEPDVKVLFMSGYTANIIARQGVLEDSVEFMPKPFNLKTLAQKVRKVL